MGATSHRVKFWQIWAIVFLTVTIKQTRAPQQHTPALTFQGPIQVQGTNLMMAAMMATSTMAIPNTPADEAWYKDSSALHHLTADINNSSHCISHQGSEQVMVRNGKTISILNIGNLSIPSASKFLHLKFVFYTPIISKKLINVNHLCTNNNAFIEFHSTFFLVKDQPSK